ncbi:hypothetical protein E4T56_gene20076 [Termitomyces sp. T112]|nr:hypothetical protein E4T56_gene20076 [Termitomyces sp. T112]
MTTDFPATTSGSSTLIKYIDDTMVIPKDELGELIHSLEELLSFFRCTKVVTGGLLSGNHRARFQPSRPGSYEGRACTRSIIQ